MPIEKKRTLNPVFLCIYLYKAPEAHLPSLDSLEQEDVCLALSHINSMARRSLNDKPAFTLFETICGEGVLGSLGLRLVPPNEVNLTPNLLGK